MVYTFARVGAVLKMRVEDVYVQGRRSWVRLAKKGGKQHEMPCHHLLDQYLADYREAVGVGLGERSVRERAGAMQQRPE